MINLSGDGDGKEISNQEGLNLVASLLGALAGATCISPEFRDILEEQDCGAGLKSFLTQDQITPFTEVMVIFTESNGQQKYLGSFVLTYRSEKDKATVSAELESYKAGLLKLYQDNNPLEKVKCDSLCFTDAQLSSPLFSRYIIEAAVNQWAVKQMKACVKELKLSLDPSHFSPTVTALFGAVDHALGIATIKPSTQLPKDLSGN